ncbi:MAG: hypothetical protein HWN67_11900 [Candidatus Helarchaeota archaeon]|nr:hypothetical protein [Candidatus Helarchaeota archaeon]
MKKNEQLKDNILEIVTNSDVPLTTKEVNDIINKPRHLTYPRLEKLLKEKKIWGVRPKKRGVWVWWRIAETNPELEIINDEIKKQENKISNLQIELKKKKKQVIKKDNNKFKDVYEELEEWYDFLGGLDNEQYTDEPYREHIGELVRVIRELLDEFGKDEDIEEYRSNLEGENEIPQALIDEHFPNN